MLAAHCGGALAAHNKPAAACGWAVAVLSKAEAAHWGAAAAPGRAAADLQPSSCGMVCSNQPSGKSGLAGVGCLVGVGE